MPATSPAGFCTSCGAARVAGANFCTSCGAALGAASIRGEASAAAASKGVSPAAIAVIAVLLAAGGLSAYFALREDTVATRAVPGAPGMPAGAAAAPSAAGEGGAPPLPQGHPGIELPAEVVKFLDELTAAAEKTPDDVEAQLRLTRARYRASVLNTAYRVSAQQALDKLLAMDPENEEGIRISANIAYDGGDFARAQAGFERFLAKQPGDPSALTDLGSALLFQEKQDEAVAKYRLALEKDPDFLQARFNLGITLHKQGKSDEALVELKKAAELAEAPEQKQHIENAIAEVEGREPAQIAQPAGRMPADHPDVARGGGADVAGGAGADADVAGGGDAPVAGGPHAGAPGAPGAPPISNAESDFQREAEKLLVTHPIVGPRIREFQWRQPASGRVLIANFPMDKMPPVVRNKFKSGMNQKLTALAAAKGVSDPIVLELVDPVSNEAMDKLDGKEMVGAFDEQR